MNITNLALIKAFYSRALKARQKKDIFESESAKEFVGYNRYYCQDVSSHSTIILNEEHKVLHNIPYKEWTDDELKNI